MSWSRLIFFDGLRFIGALLYAVGAPDRFPELYVPIARCGDRFSLYHIRLHPGPRILLSIDVLSTSL
jgi:hypothetical protein